MPGRFAPARVPPALQTTLQEPAGLPAGKESSGGRYAAIGVSCRRAPLRSQRRP